MAAAVTLALLAFIFYLNFLSRIIISPLLPAIKEEFATGATGVSGLFLALSLGYFCALLGSGFVSSRVNHKRTIQISIAAAAASLAFISSVGSMPLLYMGVLALGASTGLYLPSGIATITSIFPKRSWGRAFSVHELAPNLAFVTAPLLASLFLARASWHWLTAALSAATLLTGLMHAGTRAGTFKGAQPSLSTCSLYLKKTDFWLMTLLFCMGITSTLGVYNMLPLFLVTVHSMSKPDANMLVGMSRIATLFTAVLGGVLADRFGPRNVMGWMLLFTGGVTASLGAVRGVAVDVAVFLQPLVAVAFFPAAFSAISELSGPEERNLLISMIVPFAFLGGGGVMPMILGVFADHSLFTAGFVVVGLFLASGFLLCRMMAPARPGVLKQE